MPDFFVPFADSPEQAERVYGVFVQNHGYPIAPGAPRLFRVSVRYRGQILHAEIAQEMLGFPETLGPVLGIVESSQLLTIHTQLRGGLSATPVLFSPREVTERVYFDDFRPR